MEDKITKAEIVEFIHAKGGTEKAIVLSILNEFLEGVKNGLFNDRVVELRGFGSFEVKTRKGRANARNPKTGEIVSVKDHGGVRFTPGKELKTGSKSLRK